MHIALDPSSTAVLDRGCGTTVDLFRPAPRGATSIQWLWAMPLSRLTADDLDEPTVLRAIARFMRESGFRPEASGSSHRTLPNGVNHEQSCPFSRDCQGEHLVVAGAGTIEDHHPARETADAVGLGLALTMLGLA